LKRAQQAVSTDAGEARGSERPWIPTPMPDPGLARGRTIRRLLGALSLALAAVGAAFLFVRRPASEEEAKASAAPVATARQPDSAAASAAPTELPLVVVPTPVRPRRAASSTDVVPQPQSQPQTAAAQVRAPAPAVPAAVPTAPPAPPPRLGPGHTYAGGVTLPGGERIELGGIAWSEQEPRALLNDRIVGVGGFVAGYSVSKIDPDRVELQKDGATIVLTVK